MRLTPETVRDVDARVLMETLRRECKKPCPDCDGSRITGEIKQVQIMRHRQVWIPDVNPQTGDTDESGNGHYDFEPYPDIDVEDTRQPCELCGRTNLRQFAAALLAVVNECENMLDSEGDEAIRVTVAAGGVLEIPDKADA